MIKIDSKPKWMKQLDYLDRLVEIISKLKQLERVDIDYCGLDGAMLEAIIVALHASIHTIK